MSGPLMLQGLDQGTIPNYKRAQQSLDAQEKCLSFTPTEALE